MISDNHYTFHLYVVFRIDDVSYFLCSGLLGDSFLTPLELIFVEQVVVSYRMKVIVELEDKGDSSRHVVIENFFFGHTLQNLDHRTERIAMSDDDDILVVEDLRRNRIEPVREHSVDGDLQALSCRDRIKRQLLVNGRKRGCLSS